MTKWADRAVKLVDRIEWYRDVKYRYPCFSVVCDREISRLDKKLTRLLKPHLTEVTILGVTDDDIQRAKDHPIENLFDGRTKAINCPFHQDKRPSASIKFNRLRCFTCNKSWDTIAVKQQLDGIGFTEAVKQLR